MARTPTGVDPLGDSRDALFDAGRKATQLAESVERLETRYAHVKNPNPEYFYVPTDSDGTWGRTLDPAWTDHAPTPERRPRREAIDATLALRAAVDSAMEAVAVVAAYVDSESQSVDQRWTTRTIGHLRRLRGAIVRGHGSDTCPSALPMIREGVPDALREHARNVMDRMEEVKSAIVAGTKPRTPTVSVSPDLLDQLQRAAVQSIGSDFDAPAAKLPELKVHDRQAWQLATLHGMTQDKVAAALNKEHGTTYTQGQVSRMIGRAKAHADANGLAEKVAERIDRPRTVDPGRLELGARVDKRKPRPSDMARANDDDE